VLLALSDDF